MTENHNNDKICAEVGPSAPHDRLQEFYNEAFKFGLVDLNHRKPAFSEKVFWPFVNAVKELTGAPEEMEVWIIPDGNNGMYCANGFGHTIGILDNGYFSQSWAKKVVFDGKRLVTHPSPDGSSFIASEVCFPNDIDLIGPTFSQTSTGAMNSMKQLRELRTSYPLSIIIADIVSFFPYIPEDFWDVVDGAYCSWQKGGSLGHGGLGTFIVNKRAIEQAKRIADASGGRRVNPDPLAQHEAYKKGQTVTTPHTLTIHAATRIAQDYIQMGGQKWVRERIRSRIPILNQLVAECPHFSFFAEEAFRSDTIFAIVDDRGSKATIDHCLKWNMELATGYLPYKGTQFRFPNFLALGEKKFNRATEIIHESGTAI